MRPHVTPLADEHERAVRISRVLIERAADQLEELERTNPDVDFGDTGWLLLAGLEELPDPRI